MELAGKTLGIIGYGSIGRKVAEIAHAFGMKVLVNSRTKKKLPEGDWIRWTDRDELFAVSDVISIHCPLFPETAELINRDNSTYEEECFDNQYCQGRLHQ